MKLNLLLLLFIVIPRLKSNASVCTACTSGNFTTPSTWSTGYVPTGFDQITIPSGCTVTISTAINLTTGGPPAPSNTLFTINGVLCFSGNASRLDMVSSAVIILSVGAKITTSDSTNNSQKINIGSGQSEWNSTDGTLFGPLIISNAGLPIELMNFTGICSNSGVQLNWSTATELNNESFLIEKSSNAFEWQFVTKVPGNGTSGSVHHYKHTDYDLNSKDIMYYRLSQIDKDKTKTVFKAIDITCGSSNTNQMLLFSNPASTELNILFSMNDVSGDNTVRVMNNMSQIVMETKIQLNKGMNSFTFPLDLCPGTYHVLFASEKLVLPGQTLLVVK